MYTAEEFTLTVTIRETEVSITPALIEGIAQQTEYPVIDRVLADHGIVTFALAYDLVNAHNDGEVTIRQIAELTDLSSGTTYDLVEALYSVLNRGEPELEPTTHTPAEFTNEESLPTDTGKKVSVGHEMYTANIADTVIFRSLGKEPNPRLQTPKRAVREVDTEIWAPPVVYHELSDKSEVDAPANPCLLSGMP